MTTKRILGAMMLLLLACGPGADKPTSSPASPVEQEAKTAPMDPATVREAFVWGDESQPARDWDADAETCKARADEEEAHRLAKIAAFMECMKELGWTWEGESR